MISVGYNEDLLERKQDVALPNTTATNLKKKTLEWRATISQLPVTRVQRSERDEKRKRLTSSPSIPGGLCTLIFQDSLVGYHRKPSRSLLEDT